MRSRHAGTAHGSWVVQRIGNSGPSRFGIGWDTRPGFPVNRRTSCGFPLKADCSFYILESVDRSKSAERASFLVVTALMLCCARLSRALEFLHFRESGSIQICGMREFSGSHRSDALYQGTTLVGPLRPNKYLGFSPCAFLFAGCAIASSEARFSFSPLRPDLSRALIQNQNTASKNALKKPAIRTP